MGAARLKSARLMVDQGWDAARVAERYDVSWRTREEGAVRCATECVAGMGDRNSARRTRPTGPRRVRWARSSIYDSGIDLAGPSR
jgi:hypothetical protein